MNARMKELLDLLAQREREEDPGYMEILPPLHAEIDAAFEPPFPAAIQPTDGRAVEAVEAG